MALYLAVWCASTYYSKRLLRMPRGWREGNSLDPVPTSLENKSQQETWLEKAGT